MLLLYGFVIRFYYALINIASPFNKKAKLWLSGRQNNFSRLEKTLRNKKGPVIWMHCASLGEFEQGRPLLEQLRVKYPNHFILLTFFSPSGYEIRKQYDKVDYVSYLPLDTSKNAKRFLDIVNPALVIFVKYEFWYHFLTIVRERKIPSILVSAIFRKEQHFFKPWGGFFRKILFSFNHVFVQDESSVKLLNNLRMSNVIRSGDTRVDRVLQIAKEQKTYNEIEAFVGKQRVMVCGSTWPKDEDIIASWFEKAGAGWKLIIAPHDIQEQRLREVEKTFLGETIRYSNIYNNDFTKKRILIIDNIGMLSALYRYACMAYVGGGFGTGIHSTLEPAAYGIPICFGPNYKKFMEARELVKRGGAFVVDDDLEVIVTSLLEESAYGESAMVVRSFMKESEGATKNVVEYIDELFVA